MDPTTKALIETTGNVGYLITIGADENGLHIIDATDNRTGEYFVVRGDDLHTVARELAGQVGIEVKER